MLFRCRKRSANELKRRTCLICKDQQSNSMYLLDNRERHLMPLLTVDSSNVLMLPIGDIWIGIDAETKKPVKDGLVIERKTIVDLEASILDGRYREQRTRLLAFCQEHGAQPLYILEGGYSGTTGRLSAQSLMKVTARLQYKHGIPILHTQSLEETAALIKALDEYWTEDSANFQRSTEPLRAIDSIHVSKKVNAIDPKQFRMACLAQCTGVSVKMAETLATIYSSWSTLLAASEKDIAAIVQPGGRKVGPAVAKRLWSLFHSE